MPKSVNTTPAILATKNIFTAALDEHAEQSAWEKDIVTGSWLRQRRYRASRTMPALVQLVVPPQTVATEWLGPTFVIGEDESVAIERLTLAEREVRERSIFSSRLGRLVHKSWRLTVRSELQDIPNITGRALTVEEQEEHRQFGGSRAPSTIAELNPSVDLILGYETDWYVREGAEMSSRIDPQGQIGQLVLAHLHETSMQLL